MRSKFNWNGRNFFIGALMLILVLPSCKVSSVPVTFTYTRTPLIPVVFRGINQFYPEAQLLYENQIQVIQKEYENQVLQAQELYSEEMEVFNSKTLAEKVMQGLKEPELVLPAEPVFPFLYDTDDLANHLRIAGMTRGELNAVRVVLQVDAFEFSEPEQKINTRKRKKDGVEITDTTYHYTSRVKQPLAIYAKTPFGEEYHEFVPETQNTKLIKGNAVADTLVAYQSLINRLRQSEQNLAYDNIQVVNNLLNSLFATVEVDYDILLFEPKNTSKYDYSDIIQGVGFAKVGFASIKTNPNQATENLNNAYRIWSNAYQEFSKTGRGRMTTTVTKGVLKNLIAVSIFTENWDGALYFKLALKNLKLSGKDRRDLKILEDKYHDLRSRYEALNMN